MATGVIGIAKQRFADTIAATTAFRTWEGNSWSFAQAATHIYFDAIPPDPSGESTFSRDYLESLRPFCVIYKPDIPGSLSLNLRAVPNTFVPSGILDATFERNVPAKYAEQPGVLDAQFEEFISLLLKSGNDSTPGIAELVKSEGYLNAYRIEDMGVVRSAEEIIPTQGDHQRYFIRVWWGAESRGHR